MPDLDLSPPEILQSEDPEKNRFALFTDDWLTLQSYLAAAVNLPISEGDFVEKYGDFSGEDDIKDCIQTMGEVRALTEEFGDPKALRASLIKNPNILATAQPPADIYSHIVWMGQRVHTTASTIASSYDAVNQIWPTLGSDGAKVDALKEFLFDPTIGPIPLSAKMNDEMSDLVTKLGIFEKKISEYHERLKNYTRVGSGLLVAVSTSIGSMEEEIKLMEQARDAAWQAWRDFTIAATSTAVGCVLIGAMLAPVTLGLSSTIAVAGVAAGVALGIAAANNRKVYNQTCEDLKKLDGELQKKTQLRADLTGFNTQMDQVAPAINSFKARLQSVMGAWTAMNTNMHKLAGSVTESNVAKASPFANKLNTAVAVDKWNKVSKGAQEYTVNSLIDYEVLGFGEKMPDDAAA